MEKHPDWKPLSDEWFLAIVAKGGPSEELYEQLVREGYYDDPDFNAQALERARKMHLRQKIKKVRDGRGMPLFFHVSEEVEDRTVNFYLTREAMRYNEGQLRQVRESYFRDARYKAKVGDDVTQQINGTFARQLDFFAAWNAEQDRLDTEINGDEDEDC